MSNITGDIRSGIFRAIDGSERIPRMPKAVLTSDQVHWIRTSGLTDAHMARTLGVGYVTVHNARRGITFKQHPTPADTIRRKPGGRRSGAQAISSGKNCGLPSLSDAAVTVIRTCGLPDDELAVIYGVSRGLITKVRRGLLRADHPTPPDRFPRQFGQIRWTGHRLADAPSMVLDFEPANRTLYDRLRLRCELDADGCWIWTGTVSGSQPRPSGHHGQTSLDGDSISTHRAMWIALHGEIPDGLHVLHRCDKPPCIKPSCIWLGTHLDNMRDSIAKGRHVNVRGRV